MRWKNLQSQNIYQELRTGEKTIQSSTKILLKNLILLDKPDIRVIFLSFRNTSTGRSRITSWWVMGEGVGQAQRWRTHSVCRKSTLKNTIFCLKDFSHQKENQTGMQTSLT